MSHAEATAPEGALDEASKRRRRRLFAAVWSVVAVVVLLSFRAILVPFVLATLIAYVLSPLVRRLERARVAGRAVPRWAAIVGIYAVMLTTLGLSLGFGVPAIVAQSRNFVRNEVPRLSVQVKQSWLPWFRRVYGRYLGPPPAATPESAAPSISEQREPEPPELRDVELRPLAGGGYRLVLPDDGLRLESDHHNNYVLRAPTPNSDAAPDGVDELFARARSSATSYTGDILRAGQVIVRSVIGGVFTFFITLMLSAYLLLTEEALLAFARSLVHPAQRRAFDELLHRLDRGLSGVVRGQLIICAVNGVLSAVGFAIAGLPYWPLLALLAAVFSLVPIFGSILSSVPAVAIGLRSGLGTAVFVLVWIVGIHQIEANLLNPKIMGDAAKIHPVLVVFSLLAGEHFFGILGALLAVPVLSVVQSVFLHWRRYALSYDGDPARETSLPPAPPEPAQ